MSLDDIFDSTRYAKALEAIKAERKNYASQAKDLKAELEGLNSHKFAATGFREELEDCMVGLPLFLLLLLHFNFSLVY
jgi:hypothetical protein